MKVYRGSATEDFKIKEDARSRYGFKALFFSETPQSATLYAKSKKGYLHSFEVSQHIQTIDFGGDRANGRRFATLMHQLNKAGVPAARIVNVLDYPNNEYLSSTESNIVVVFDLERVKRTNPAPLILE